MHSEPSHTEILQRCQIPNIDSSLSSAEHSRFLHGTHHIGYRHPGHRSHAGQLLMGKSHMNDNSAFFHLTICISQCQKHIFHLDKRVIKCQLLNLVNQHLGFAHQGGGQVVHQIGVFFHPMVKFLLRNDINFRITVGTGLGDAPHSLISIIFPKKTAFICHIKAAHLPLAVDQRNIYSSLFYQIDAIFHPYLVIDDLPFSIAPGRMSLNQVSPLEPIHHDPGRYTGALGTVKNKRDHTLTCLLEIFFTYAKKWEK